ncbi:unnamed protein product, partial [Amoebophrya sp. A25]
WLYENYNPRKDSNTGAPKCESKSDFLKILRDFSADKQTPDRVPENWLPEDWRLFTTEVSKALNHYYESEYCQRPPTNFEE